MLSQMQTVYALLEIRKLAFFRCYVTFIIELLCYHLLSLIHVRFFFFFKNSDFSLTLLPVTLRKDLYYFILSVCLKAISFIRLVIDHSSKERNLHT